jgi:hypothetical protein
MNSGPAQSAVDFCALIYGSLVSSLLEMTEDPSEIDRTLDALGFRLGCRLAHDFARRVDRVDGLDAVIGVIEKQWSGAIGNSQVEREVLERDRHYVLKFHKSVYTKQLTWPEGISGESFRYESMLPGAVRGICQVFHHEVACALRAPAPDATFLEVTFKRAIPVAVRKEDD